jgi:hypothetical protein
VTDTERIDLVDSAGSAQPPDTDVSVIVALGAFDPLDTSQNADIHGLIRRFRSGDAAAFADVLAAARRAIENDADLAARWLLVVPVPGHEPGAASPVLSRLTMELARGTAWIVPAPPPLCRVAAVAAAKDRGVRASDQELASLRWAEGRRRHGCGTVVCGYSE